MTQGADSLDALAGIMQAGPELPSLMSLTLRALLLLAFLLLAAFLLARMKKKWIRPGKGRAMEVLSALPLGYRRQAVLLRVSGRVLLLGLGEGGVQTLGRFSGAEAEDLIQATGGSTSAFRLNLDRALRDEGEQDEPA